MLRKYFAAVYRSGRAPCALAASGVRLSSSDVTATSVALDESGAVLTLTEGGEGHRFGARWLRDHCSCAACLHQTTFQRQYNSLALAQGVTLTGADLTDRGRLRLSWSDGHSSDVKTSWLSRCKAESELGRPEDFAFGPLLKPTTWSNSTMASPPTVSYDLVMNSEDGVREWAQHIQTYGCAIVNGMPAKFSPESTRKVVERLAPVRQSFFGDFWSILVTAPEEENAAQEEELEHGDTAYTNLPLGAHTDGTYFTDPPGLQFFQIPEHTGGSGGQTVLVDGFYIAEQLQKESPEAWQYLSEKELHFHYYEDGVCLRRSGPVFTRTAGGQLLRYSYNNDDRTVAYLPPEEEAAHYDAIAALLHLLGKRESQCRVQLEADQLLVTNNWRVMHGRTRFTGTRRLAGCYVSMEHFLSRCRLLAAQPPLEGPCRTAP